jgi:hypothetical protein
MNSKEYLTRKYCEPKPYWRCVHELSGGNYYSFNELNYAEYWLDALAKYTEEKRSAAAKQLHRRVEVARDEFKAKQDRAWGAGGVDRAIYEEKERPAWNTFNSRQQAYLNDYLRAIETGVVRSIRLCIDCKQREAMEHHRICRRCQRRRERSSLFVA